MGFCIDNIESLKAIREKSGMDGEVKQGTNAFSLI